MKLQKDLTTHKVPLQITVFVLPLIISDLLSSLYNAVDMVFVGQFAGINSLAAVSVCGPIMTILVIVISGFSSGVAVVVANYKGRNDEDSVRRAGNTSCAFYLVLALATTCLGQIFVPQILNAVQTPLEALGEANIYLRTVFLGLVFQFGYGLICALQRGFGDSKSPMVFVIIASFINLACDFMLVGLLHMGAFGAALGTVIAQACTFFMGILHFRRGKHVITFRLGDIRFHKTEMLAVFRIGLPTALNEVFVTIAMLTVSAVANTYGVACSAAYGIGRNIDNFATISDSAMNNAMAVFASQNVGAGKPERALTGLKSAAVLSVCISICFTPFVYFFADQLVSIFDRTPEVITAATTYLRVASFSYVLFAMVGPLIGFIRGTGNQFITVIVGLIAQYVFRVPTAFIATKYMGFSGLGVAILVGPLSSVVMYTAVVVTGLWKRGIQNLRAISKK